MAAKTPLLTKLLIIAILLLGLMSYFLFFSPVTDDKSVSEIRKPGPDSLRREQEQIHDRSKSIFILFAGLVEIPGRYADTNRGESSPRDKKGYYFLLPGYHIDNPFDFVIHEGDYFLERVAYEQKRDEGLTRQLYPMAVRFNPDRSYYSGEIGKNKGSVLVPISFKSYRTLRTIAYALMVVSILYACWVVFVLPIRILLSIIKGQPFTRQTVKHLFIIGCSLMGAVLLALLMAVISQLVFSDKIPAGFSFSYLDFMSATRGVFIAGFIVLIFAIAFKRGLEIKEDRALYI